MRHHSVCGAALATALLLVGCTPALDPAPSPAVTAVQAPPTAFAALPGTSDTGSNDWVDELAADGNDVVAVGKVFGWRSIPTFRRSTDGGRTWQEGSLDDASLQQTTLGSSESPSEVVHAPGSLTGWLAVGSVDHGVAWTSADGLTWTRHAIPEAVLDSHTDSIEDLQAGVDGYVAVGSRTVGEDTTPLAWTSADGLTWVRHALPGRGSAAAVAIRGQSVAAVGSVDKPSDSRAWRSLDGGQHWSRSNAIPRPPKDGDFMRYLSSVHVTKAGFAALGSASTDDWEPTLYRSDDGIDWTYDGSAKTLDRDASAFGGVLADGDDTALSTDRNARFGQLRLWRRDGQTWQPASTPLDGQPVTANWATYSLVRTAAGWLVAVIQENNGRLRGHLWFSADGSHYTDAGYPPSRWNVATIFPGTLVLLGGQPLVTGRAEGLPAVWKPGSTTPPASPAAIERDARYAQAGATSAGGKLVVWGSDLGGNSRYATVWISTDGRTFSRTRPDTFGKYDLYGYSDINRVRRIGSRWIAVGEQSSNGTLNRSALVATSVDARTWRAAKSSGRTAHVGKTRYAVTDLAGSEDHVRTARDVVAVPGGVLAVGAAAESGEMQPAVWDAASGAGGREVWSMRRLPLAGYATATMEVAQSRGTHVVALGTARKKGSATDLPYVWDSKDAGLHWTGGLLPLGSADPTQVDADDLLATGTGFVVVGSVTGDVTRPLAWRSTDGRRWADLPLAGLPGAPGESVWLHGATISGHQLVGLVDVDNTAGSGTTVFRQDVG